MAAQFPRLDSSAHRVPRPRRKLPRLDSAMKCAARGKFAATRQFGPGLTGLTVAATGGPRTGAARPWEAAQPVSESRPSPACPPGNRRRRHRTGCRDSGRSRHRRCGTSAPGGRFCSAFLTSGVSLVNCVRQNRASKVACRSRAGGLSIHCRPASGRAAPARRSVCLRSVAAHEPVIVSQVERRGHVVAQVAVRILGHQRPDFRSCSGGNCLPRH